MNFGDGASFQNIEYSSISSAQPAILSQEMIKPEGASTKMYDGYVLMRLEGRHVEGKFQSH